MADTLDSTTTVSAVTITPAGAKKIIKRPRMQIIVNGNTMTILDGTVTKNGHYNAAEFKGSVSPWLLGLDFWVTLGLDQQKVSVVVQRGEESEDGSDISWDTVFDGILDEVEIEADQGKVSLECRDRIALLIDRKIYKAYPNKTAAEIITELCKEVGITVNIQGGKTLAGTLYARDHTNVKQGEFSQVQTYWDLICKLAQATNNVVQMDGTTLTVMPNEADTSNPWLVNFSPPVLSNGNIVALPHANVKKLSISHKLLATKDILVRVKSFHSKTGKGYAVTSGNKGKVQNQTVYEYYYPNLMPDEAQKKADEIYLEKTSHELVITVTASANWNVTPYRTAKIVGAPSLSDLFYVDHVSWTMSFDGGAEMTVTLKNHPQLNETSA